MTQHHIAGGLYVRERGAGARAIAYVHGLGESGLSFEALLDQPLLTAHRQVAIDLPGYGKSPWRSEPLELGVLADTLLAALGTLGIVEVVIAGHAMGGVLALLAAERGGTRVRGLLDIEGNVSPDDCDFSRAASGYTPESFVSEGHERLLGRVFDAGRTNPSLRGYFASMRMCDPRQLHFNACELVTLSTTGDIARRLAALPMPVQYLAGAPDGTGLTSRRLLAEAGVETVAIHNAGHWPFLDQPTAFAEAVRVFLDAIP